MALKLTPLNLYQVKVTDIQPMKRRLSFKVKDDTYYNFVLTVEMKDKSKGDVEYASPNDQISDLPFTIGVLQWMQCKKCSDMGCEVVPCDPPNEPISRIDEARKLVDKNFFPPSKAQSTDQPATLSLSGNSFIFCLSYVKDLMVAEIANMPIGYIIDPINSVEKMFNMAKDLNARTVEFLNPNK